MIFMVTVELSIQASNGKWMSQEIACLRPHPGDDIFIDGQVFQVRATALEAGESKVLARVVHSGRKRPSARMLSAIGFSPVDDSD